LFSPILLTKRTFQHHATTPTAGFRFNEAYYTGLSRNLPRLEALVQQAPVDDLEFLDKGILLDCLQRAALGNAGDAGSVTPLHGTLSLLVWLTQQRGGLGRSECVETVPAAA